MQPIVLGPLVFSGDRFAVIIGVLTFMIASSIVASRMSASVTRWASWTAALALVGARGWHVAVNIEPFLVEPSRILAIGQGGFAWEGAALGVALASVWLLRSKKEIAGAAIALAIGLFAWHLTTQLVGRNAGRPLPELTLISADGRETHLHGFKGRPLVVNLWASWCPPCRREMPMMAATAAAMPEIPFLFVNSGEGLSAIRRYLATQKFELPNILQDPLQQMARHYEMPGLPVTLFIAPDGRLVFAHIGEISSEALQGGILQLRRDHH